MSLPLGAKPIRRGTPRGRCRVRFNKKLWQIWLGRHNERQQLVRIPL